MNSIARDTNPQAHRLATAVLHWVFSWRAKDFEETGYIKIVDDERFLALKSDNRIERFKYGKIS